MGLRPEARERLAKLAGIVIAHQGLNLAVEGHTDNVNTDEFNQKLSEERAGTFRAHLIAGLDPNSVTGAGYGMSQPVADNTTAAGRQKNRRVEILISGEIIGVKIGVKWTSFSKSSRADTVCMRRDVEEAVTLDWANNISTFKRLQRLLESNTKDKYVAEHSFRGNDVLNCEIQTRQNLVSKSLYAHCGCAGIFAK